MSICSRRRRSLPSPGGEAEPAPARPGPDPGDSIRGSAVPGETADTPNSVLSDAHPARQGDAAPSLSPRGDLCETPARHRTRLLLPLPLETFAKRRSNSTLSPLLGERQVRPSSAEFGEQLCWVVKGGHGGIPHGLVLAHGVADHQQLACRRSRPPWAACRRRAGAGSRPAGGGWPGSRRMYSWARPPQTRRGPRQPLSRLKGATPTSAATCGSGRVRAPRPGVAAATTGDAAQPASAGLLPVQLAQVGPQQGQVRVPARPAGGRGLAAPVLQGDPQLHPALPHQGAQVRTALEGAGRSGGRTSARSGPACASSGPPWPGGRGRGRSGASGLDHDDRQAGQGGHHGPLGRPWLPDDARRLEGAEVGAQPAQAAAGAQHAGLPSGCTPGAAWRHRFRPWARPSVPSRLAPGPRQLRLGPGRPRSPAKGPRGQRSVPARPRCPCHFQTGTYKGSSAHPPLGYAKDSSGRGLE